MNVLVACERSGVVRDAFRKVGHYAYSADLEPSDNGCHHIQGDVVLVLDWGWDLMIAHPPCRYLAVSGARWFKDRQAEQLEALEFVRTLMDAPIPKICIENPVSVISSRIRKPDQIIQPYEFGHPESKKTCLWLDGLPPLIPTDITPPTSYGCACGCRFDYKLGRHGCPNCLGENPTKPLYNNQTPSGQNKLGPSPTRSIQRATTYAGIARAMAEQWGKETT